MDEQLTADADAMANAPAVGDRHLLRRQGAAAGRPLYRLARALCHPAAESIRSRGRRRPRCVAGRASMHAERTPGASPTTRNSVAWSAVSPRSAPSGSTTTTSTTGTSSPPRRSWARPTLACALGTRAGRARGGHRRTAAACGDPRSAGVRPLRRPLLGVGHCPLRRWQQPGVQLRGGERLERRGPVGPAHRRRAAARPGHLVAEPRGGHSPCLLGGADLPGASSTRSSP